jgi:hypothetical protein
MAASFRQNRRKKPLHGGKGPMSASKNQNITMLTGSAEVT